MAKTISEDKLKALKNEIQMSIKLNEDELRPIMDECVARYTGQFIPEFGLDWDILINEFYPVVQNYLPGIFFRTPRAILKPKQKTYIAKRRDPISGEMVEMQLESAKSASSQEAILNYSVSEEMPYKQEVRKTLLDALICPFGIMWHGYKGSFGMTEEQSMFILDDKVFVKRLPQMRFIYDPAVTINNLEEARWTGRIIDVPLMDLLDDDKLDVNEKEIKGFHGFGQKLGNKSSNIAHDTQSPSKRLIDFADNEFKRSARSKFVKVYEIYMRPDKKEKRKGDKGSILLLTDEQVKPLRVNDWKIKAEGWPGKPLFFNDIPDAIFPASDIEFYKQIADQKNAIFNLQLRNAHENSKVWVGLSKEGADEEDIEAVRQGDNTIVTFETGNVRDRMQISSPGGAASNELYLVDQRIQKNLEDKTGITDLQRGFLQSGEESATSASIRQAGGAVRISYRQDIMTDYLKCSFKYINQLNRQFKTVKDAVRIIGTLDVAWVDDISREELQAEVDVDISVFSMLPENPEREVRSLNTVLAMMVQALQAPEIRTKILQEGKTMNLSPLIEQILQRLKIKDPEIFTNVKPEESEGFVSAQQLSQAQENVQASITGQPLPFEPQPDDDHRAKLSIYMGISELLKELGQESEQLMQLIQVHQLLLEEIKKKGTNPPQNIKLKKPTLETI